MITEAVAQYLARGGKITEASGFASVRPLPAYRPPKTRGTKARTGSGRKRATGIEPREGRVRIDFIAHGAGYASPEGLRNKKVAALMPKPLKQRGHNGSLLYDKAEALEAIEKIKELRSGFAAATKDVGAALHRYANYAKKQRDRLELAKEWGELDNATP